MFMANVGKYTDIHGSWIVCPSPTKVVYWYMKDGKLLTRILDMSIGPGFSCSWEDLNNDPGWKVRWHFYVDYIGRIRFC